MKDWISEWFYASNLSPHLAVHSEAGPVVNDRWEKMPLTAEELDKTRPFLEKIKVLKQKGLTGFRIVASYIQCWVQPLRARESYDFKYSGAEDPSRLVAIEKLFEGEVLLWISKILKGVSVVPHRVAEHDAANSPLVVSVFIISMFFYSSSPFFIYLDANLKSCRSGDRILMICPLCP
jgi:hypothetical protein